MASVSAPAVMASTKRLGGGDATRRRSNV